MTIHENNAGYNIEIHYENGPDFLETDAFTALSVGDFTRCHDAWKCPAFMESLPYAVSMSIYSFSCS